MKKDVIVVGAGCIGLMSAYCLQKSGRSVTVIDKMILQMVHLLVMLDYYLLLKKLL